jgi:hypothetical protein
MFRPKKNTIHKQGSLVSILWYKKFDENFQQLENSIKFTVDKQKSSGKNLFMKIVYICIHSNDQKSQIHFMPATWWFFQFV